MSRLLAVCALAMVCGCASASSSPRAERPAVPESANEPVLTGGVETANNETAVAADAEDGFADTDAAAALAFDLPSDDPYREPLDLSREGRERSAFMGYDEGVAEYYAVRWDDRQSDSSYRDRYERRAVSVKVGVRYR